MQFFRLARKAIGDTHSLLEQSYSTVDVCTRSVDGHFPPESFFLRPAHTLEMTSVDWSLVMIHGGPRQKVSLISQRLDRAFLLAMPLRPLSPQLFASKGKGARRFGQITWNQSGLRCMGVQGSLYFTIIIKVV